MLAGHHLSDLSGLEIGNLDLAAEDVDRGAGDAHGYAKLRTLDQGGGVRRVDLKMLHILSFDLEQDRARVLLDRGRETFLLFRGKAEYRIRRD